MSKSFTIQTPTSVPKDFGVSKVTLTEECMDILASKLHWQSQDYLFQKGEKTMTSCMGNEMETVCHCNLRENAQLIADILDADVEGKVYSTIDWTPTAERLPDRADAYLVTVTSGSKYGPFVDVVFFFADPGYWDCSGFDVLAWAERPEPWEREEEE